MASLAAMQIRSGARLVTAATAVVVLASACGAGGATTADQARQGPAAAPSTAKVDARLDLQSGSTADTGTSGAGTSGAAGAAAPATRRPAKAPARAATSSAARPAAAPAARAARTGGTAATNAAAGSTAAAAAPAAFGNPRGKAAVPAAGRAVDTRRPNRVVGNGTARSCTSQAVVAAVARGGIITFRCGSKPVVIRMAATAKVRNTSARVVLDGGGKVTLSGAGVRRILYMNTCDPAQVWTTSHCQNQATPQLVVQNLTFADGNSTGERMEGGGGGAIFVRGGQFKVVNSRFIRNRCDTTGPDVGGAAIRVLDQFAGRPVYVVRSTFGGTAKLGGRCSNGGAISSIGVSWQILNSVMVHNRAIGRGANPAKPGTPGGGSGGAIYNDGNQMTLRIAGSILQDNVANEGGGGVFFVSNNRTGTMRIEDSVLQRNRSLQFETRGLKGIFFLGRQAPTIVRSVVR